MNRNINSSLANGNKTKKKREEVMALVATYNFPEPEDL